MGENDLSGAARLEAMAEEVRLASREGRVLSLDQVWEGGAEAYRAVAGELGPSMCPDIVELNRSGELYLYSERHMTHRYAETAVRIAGGDVPAMIAEAVRSDSETYPRPTPVGTFAAEPFSIPSEELKKAIAALFGRPEYTDIERVQASDGSLFLFSSPYLPRAQAGALAERMAVSLFENP